MSDYTNQILAISKMHSPVKDTETAIIVNVGTRDFSLGSKFNNLIGVVGDHNSNEVTFQLPRYIDSHDISQCSKHTVLWENPKAETSGEFSNVSISVSEDENMVFLPKDEKEVTFVYRMKVTSFLCVKNKKDTLNLFFHRKKY